MKDKKTLTACLADIKKFAVHDGPGIRTTLFLKGCSLKCIWCHNPESISIKPQIAYYSHKCINCGECVAICPSEANEMVSQGHIFHREKCVLNGKCESVCLGGAFKLYGKTITIDDALKLVLEDRAFYENSGGGVTVSGGEPLLQADFVHEFFINLKKKNIHTALDTSGQVSWSAFKKIIPVTDMFLYDIKHIDSKSHKLLTGHGSELILENLRKLSALGCRIEIRIPLVPGSNNDDKTIHGIGNFLSTLKIERIKVLPYHSMARSKYEALNMEDTMPHVEPPTDSELNNAIDILRSYGLNAVSGRE